MWKFSLLLTLLLAQPRDFELDGQVVSTAKQAFRWVEIESIDHRFVESGDLDPDGRFVFKKIPEGLYKLIITAQGGREEGRTVEIRPAFADARGRIAVHIELQDSGVRADQFKVGAGALGISPKAKDELRKAYEARGDVAKARQHLQKAIDISPNFDEALNNLGTLYYHDREYEQARELFERALRANPNSFPAQVNLGGALISLGDRDRALTENQKALEMRPGDSLAQSQMGQALFNVKRYDEALDHLETAKQIDPMSFTLPGLFIARIYQIRGNTARAIAEYKEFLEVHPGNSYTAFVQRQIALLENQ